MFRLLKIYILVGISTFAFANQLQDNFSISFPESIPNGKTFQVSLITSAEYFDADELQLILVSGSGINLKSAFINSVNGLSKIEIENTKVDGITTEGKKLKIDLQDSTLTGKTFFQILFEFSSLGEDKTGLRFQGTLIKDGAPAGYLICSDEKLKNESENFYSIEFAFYEVMNVKNHCLKLNPNSSLLIPLDFKIENNLFAEFWMRLEKSPQAFLSIKNSVSKRIEYQLSTNEFQMLSADSKYNSQNLIISEFISDKIWYHISILFDIKNNLISFYINGNVFGEFILPEIATASDLFFEFSNSSSSSFYSVDQFKVSDLSGEPECMFKYKNFTSNYCENTINLLQINFNEDETNQLKSNKLLEAENLRFSKSDAPLHPAVPEINVIISNNYFEIEFTAVENKNVLQYVIEKSTDDHEFLSVKNFVVENNLNKNYSCLIEKTDESELVYFRLKQINKDGTELYSGQIKIGQGMVEDILLGQNFPNPFNPSTQIDFELLQDGEVEVKVFNLGGQEVAKLHEGFLAKGIHQLKFDASELPSGIYLLRVSTANFTQARKMILAK